jgi:ribosomal protein L37AE/L43A
MLGNMTDEVRFSYCSYCIECQDFHIVDGVWMCEKCNRPIRRASQSSAENNEKSLQSKSVYGTIVTGGNYG